MRAAYVAALGPAEDIQMGEIADLNVAATDVLVQCQALAVNFVETQVRSGSCPPPRAFPFVIGSYLIRPALPAQRKPARIYLAVGGACGSSRVGRRCYALEGGGRARDATMGVGERSSSVRMGVASRACC